MLQQPTSLHMHRLRKTTMPTTHQTPNHMPNMPNQNPTNHKLHNHKTNNKQRNKNNPTICTTLLGRTTTANLQQNLHRHTTPHIHRKSKKQHYRLHLIRPNKKRHHNRRLSRTPTTPKQRNRQSPNQKSRSRNQATTQEKTARFNIKR